MRRFDFKFLWQIRILECPIENVVRLLPDDYLVKQAKDNACKMSTIYV